MARTSATDGDSTTTTVRYSTVQMMYDDVRYGTDSFDRLRYGYGTVSVRYDGTDDDQMQYSNTIGASAIDSLGVRYGRYGTTG